MNVDITYTNVNGETKAFTATSVDNAVETLNGFAGYRETAMDDIVKKLRKA